MMKKYSRWSGEQREAAIRMSVQGLTSMQIARKMGQKQESVRRCLWMWKCSLSAVEALQHRPREVITKSEIPDFYALGWRLASFVNGAIIFEWPTDDPPLYPKQALQEAA